VKKKRLYHYLGQSTTEYAVLIAVVVSALIGMQVYIKRGIQGKIRDLADQVSSAHYEAGRVDSFYTTTQSGKIVQQHTETGFKLYMDGTDEGHYSEPEKITRSGSETIYPEEE
jgi:Flp pilus assembly pilin Flp